MGSTGNYDGQHNIVQSCFQQLVIFLPCISLYQHLGVNGRFHTWQCIEQQGAAHSPPESLCIMEVNEIFSKYFAYYYRITQY